MRLLIHPEKREIVEGREQIVAKEKRYFVTNMEKDVRTLYGVVSKEELRAPSGSVIKTKDTEKEFIILDADFVDIHRRFKKLPQTIPIKDIGLIIAETGINSRSIVVDGGVGSGALAASLGNICKKVFSYDVRADHIKVSKENIELTGLENVEVKQKSLYDGIDEIGVDLVTLDLPEPWKVVEHAKKALRVGGYIVSYSPSVPQVQDFTEKVRQTEGFEILKTVEIIERKWEARGRKVRPKSISIGHSGFLTFARKIKA